jgi:threonine synthase
MDKIREGFAGYSASEEETLDEIGVTFAEKGYLIDPHSAVAFRCHRKYRGETKSGAPAVVVSTASPYKFPADVLRALGKEVASDDPRAAFDALSSLTGTVPPAPLTRTMTLPVRFRDSVAPADMDRAIFG